MENSRNERIALLAGATGLVGSHCLQILLNKADYKIVKILVRKKTAITHPKLQEFIIDFEKIKELDREILIADDVFCCLGTTIKKAGSKEKFKKVDLEYPVELAKAAKAAGAKRFLIVTAIGADKNSVFFYNRVKGEVEFELKKIQFKALHIFRPSLLAGKRNEERLGEKIGYQLSQIASPLFQGGLKKYRPIKAKVVAEAMVARALDKSEGHFIHESDEISEEE